MASLMAARATSSADVQAFTGSLGNGACVVTAGTPGALNCDFSAGTGVGDASPITQLNPGESITVVVHMHSVLNSPEGNNVWNTAVLDAEEIDELDAGGTLAIDNDPRLTITKSLVDGPTVGHAGSGDTASFVIVITNPSAVNATGVDLNDTLPAGLEFVAFNGGTDAECIEFGGVIALNVATITAGDTITCDFEVQLAAGIVAPITSYLNTAVLTAADPDVELTASAAVQAAVPSLSLTKTSSNASISTNSGSTVTFTVTVTNTGTALAQNVDITDTLPAGLSADSVTCPGGFTTSGTTCINGTIAAGASVVMTLVVQVSDDTIANGTILTNVATAIGR